MKLKIQKLEEQHKKELEILTSISKENENQIIIQNNLEKSNIINQFQKNEISLFESNLSSIPNEKNQIQNIDYKQKYEELQIQFENEQYELDCKLRQLELSKYDAEREIYKLNQQYEIDLENADLEIDNYSFFILFYFIYKFWNKIGNKYNEIENSKIGRTT